MKKISLQTWLLIIWLGFVLFVNFLWMKIDHRPPRWDESTNLQMSERAHQLVKKFKIIEALHTQGITRPTFVPFLTGLSYFVVGHSTKRAVFLLNSVSFLIIFISIYALGTILYGKTSGLLGCILFTCYSNIILWSRYYTLDIPLTAITSLTILLCVLTYKNEFRSVKWSMLLGFTVAVGMCVKHLYAGFVFFPMAYLCFSSLRDKDQSLAIIIRRRKHFFLFLALGLLAGLMYHVLNYQTLLELYRRATAPLSTSLAGIGYIPPSVYEILSGFIYHELGGPFFTIIFLLGFAFSLLKISKSHLFLYLWLLGSFLLLLYVIKVTMPYYFHPVLPVFALLSSAWASWNPPTRMKTRHLIQTLKLTAVIGVCVYAIGLYLEKSLGTRNMLKIIMRSPTVLSSTKRINANPFVEKPYWINAYVDGNIATLPYPHYWYVDEMLDEMVRYVDMTQSKRTYRLASLTNYEWMTLSYLSYKIWQRGLNNKLFLSQVLPSSKNITPEKFLEGFDFLITKTGRVLKNDFYNQPWAIEIQSFVDHLLEDNGRVLAENHFEQLKQFPLPDGSTGSVWVSMKKLNTFTLADYLPFVKTDGDPGAVSTSVFNINGDERFVIYEHPSGPGRITRIHWSGMKIRTKSMLKFGIALSPNVWAPKKGDGVEFLIDIESESGKKTIFSRYIDPKNTADDRKWFDYELSLDEFAGQTINIIFTTLPGPNGNAFDHAGWSSPKIEIKTLQNERQSTVYTQ
ncbi:MAG: glycosyltransferase family 39 protein [Deltaproteobacteria bacterium]|nr:glycosyltransferase family 39 protein [Deltaproteobacteria bacterium]